MNSLVDRVIEWFAPPMPKPTVPAARKSVAPSEEWLGSAQWEHEWRRQRLDMEMELFRARLRHEAAWAREAKRNSMIGKLDDCRWRVSVLMASKKLPADYAMRLP